MISKEEIEKAKEGLLEIKEDFDWDLQHKSSRTDEEINLANKYSKSIEALLQYIDQLEQENNKQSKIIDEMAIYIGLVLKEDDDKMFCNDKNNCDGNCDKCIKQYFEKKVEKLDDKNT